MYTKGCAGLSGLASSLELLLAKIKFSGLLNVTSCIVLL